MYDVEDSIRKWRLEQGRLVREKGAGRAGSEGQEVVGQEEEGGEDYRVKL
jgi:hypothetical protein